MNSKVHLDLECNGVKASFDGNLDEVLDSLIKFLTDTVPTFEAARKILYTADLTRLIDSVEGLIVVTSDGSIILEKVKASVGEAVCLGLTGAYIAKKIGRREKDSLSPIELGRIIGKATKTVRNELPNLINSGLVERVEKGKYRITAAGLRFVEKEVAPSLRRV
ncbi:hypothetical protein J7L06_03510 [Candidatus Bathyarchaeota archaeon]|nr:hypothetical protein [Candidatus Bathyarchaeota archaeon]